jgi:hypothetical protein
VPERVKSSAAAGLAYMPCGPLCSFLLVVVGKREDDVNED